MKHDDDWLMHVEEYSWKIIWRELNNAASRCNCDWHRTIGLPAGYYCSFYGFNTLIFCAIFFPTCQHQNTAGDLWWAYMFSPVKKVYTENLKLFSNTLSQSCWVFIIEHRLSRHRTFFSPGFLKILEFSPVRFNWHVPCYLIWMKGRDSA